MTRSQRLESQLPVLTGTNYEVTSPLDRSYNCAAWASGDDARWWEPNGLGGYYWPPGLPVRDWRISNYQRAYEHHGFVPCADDSLEAGIEKIALYERGGAFCHAARQLEDGRWTSKCGQLHDITHDTPNDLGGTQNVGYGDVVLFMQRPRK